MDGASNSFNSGASLILTNSEGVVAKYGLRCAFKASNNQAEYGALLVGLRITKELGVMKYKAFTDSQLVVS